MKLGRVEGTSSSDSAGLRATGVLASCHRPERESQRLAWSSAERPSEAQFSHISGASDEHFSESETGAFIVIVEFEVLL